MPGKVNGIESFSGFKEVMTSSNDRHILFVLLIVVKKKRIFLRGGEYNVSIFYHFKAKSVV